MHMMRFARQVIRANAVLVALALVFVLPARLVNSAQSAAKGSLRDAIAQWQEYRQLAQFLEGSGKFEVRDRTEDGRVLKRSETTFVLNGDWGLHVFESRGQRARASGINSKYGFTVTSTPGDGWRVEEIARHGIRETAPDGIPGDGPLGETDGWGAAMKEACRGMVIWATWLPRVVASGDFKVKAMTRVAQGGDQLVKVEFEYEPGTTDLGNVVRSGVVVLDPKRYWLIREAKVRGTWGGGREKGTITVKNEYDDDKVAFPVLSRQVMHVSSNTPDGPVDVHSIFQFDVRVTNPKDESRFTLSAFGLPEPAVPSRPWLRAVYFFLGLVAIVCLVIAGRFLRRKAT
jgi:hypothetical protein